MKKLSEKEKEDLRDCIGESVSHFCHENGIDSLKVDVVIMYGEPYTMVIFFGTDDENDEFNEKGGAE